MSAREGNGVERAAAQCALCREGLESLRQTRALLQALPELEPARSFVFAAAPVATPAATEPARRLIFRAPAWAYAGAASLAGLAIVLFVLSGGIGLWSPSGESHLSDTMAMSAPAEETELERSVPAAQEAAPAMAMAGRAELTPMPAPAAVPAAPRTTGETISAEAPAEVEAPVETEAAVPASAPAAASPYQPEAATATMADVPAAEAAPAAGERMIERPTATARPAAAEALQQEQSKEIETTPGVASQAAAGAAAATAAGEASRAAVAKSVGPTQAAIAATEGLMSTGAEAEAVSLPTPAPAGVTGKAAVAAEPGQTAAQEQIATAQTAPVGEPEDQSAAATVTAVPGFQGRPDRTIPAADSVQGQGAPQEAGMTAEAATAPAETGSEPEAQGETDGGGTPAPELVEALPEAAGPRGPVGPAGDASGSTPGAMPIEEGLFARPPLGGDEESLEPDSRPSLAGPTEKRSGQREGSETAGEAGTDLAERETSWLFAGLGAVIVAVLVLLAGYRIFKRKRAQG